MNRDKIIEARNVSKWYGAFPELKDINLTVSKGERIVICGSRGLRQVNASLLFRPAGSASGRRNFG